MKLAALDLGSNSFLCLIADIDQQRKIVVEQDLLHMVRLGEGLQSSRRFSEAALQRADAALKLFKENIKKANCDHVLAFATAAARDAINKEDLFQICKNHQIPIEIVSGPQEAEVTFFGATCEVADMPSLKLQPDSYQLVIDIGGRSTEMILGYEEKIKFARSLNIGCVGFTEEFKPLFPLESEAILKIQQQIQHVIHDTVLEILNLVQGKQIVVIAVAGTPTTLAAMEVGKYSVAAVEGFEFTAQRLENWSNHLATRTPLEIQRSYGIEFKRADVIYVGAEILNQILKKISETRPSDQSIHVSTKGIRYGVMKEMMKRLKL
ncbi:MAG: hypothetical protein ACK5WZ_06105 [Pseudobdellovibrionaceae bacterium]